MMAAADTKFAAMANRSPEIERDAVTCTGESLVGLLVGVLVGVLVGFGHDEHALVSPRECDAHRYDGRARLRRGGALSRRSASRVVAECKRTCRTLVGGAALVSFAMALG